MLPRVTIRRVAVSVAVGVIVTAIAIWAYQRHARQAFDRAWQSDLKALGARIVSSRSVSEIPFVGIRFATATLLDVYLMQATTADAVVERALQNPKMNRIFIRTTAVGAESVDTLARRVRRARPDVQVILVREDETVERWVPPEQQRVGQSETTRR